MLRQLAVNNIVLVERLELEFEPGLGVLTGETGAGKSILLDALGLALGARADTSLVRTGQESASVSAEISLSATHPALALLAEHGIEPEYFAAVDPETFETPGDLIVIAATIGTTRLIDNAKAATPERRGADPKGAVSVLPTP